MATTADGDELARRLYALREHVERRVKGPAGMHDPDWGPLERVLATHHCAGFMWMGWAVRPDGAPIARYKHGITRRYLNLDEDGNAYRYVSAPDPAWCGSHVRIPLELALDEVFDGLERMYGVNADDPRSTPYDDAYRRARNAALRRAGLTVVEL